jgi:hypothetical protein
MLCATNVKSLNARLWWRGFVDHATDTARSDREIGKLLDQIDTSCTLGWVRRLGARWCSTVPTRTERSPNSVETVPYTYTKTEGLLPSGDEGMMILAPKEPVHHCLQCCQQPDLDGH